MNNLFVFAAEPIGETRAIALRAPHGTIEPFTLKSVRALFKLGHFLLFSLFPL